MTHPEFCDLHTHSNCSDGSCTPEELVLAAKAACLKAVALTDHNTVAGLSDFSAACEKHGVLPVCGCEFNTDWQGAEIHILGLFLPRNSWDEIAAYTEIRNQRKHRSNRECTERLAAAGYDISYDDILRSNSGTSINRVHIARALLEKGYVSSVKDAFDRLLQPKHGFFQNPALLDALETIRHIKSWGGTAVWAHPPISIDISSAEAFLPEAKQAGLDGLETLYARYSPEDTRRMQWLAHRYSLLSSGGSDFHGDNNPGISIGSGKGDLRIPMEYLVALSERSRAH